MVSVVLKREYFSQGTNGEIWINGELICYAIELPWLKNSRKISCIPEGSYTIAKRYSQKFGWHILVKDVPGRDGILFHPANDAIKELQGCIAPVTQFSGIGKGHLSKLAFERLRKKVYEYIDQGHQVVLTIKRKD